MAKKTKKAEKSQLPKWLTDNKVYTLFVRFFVAIKTRVSGLLVRRPHRSFRLTRRRDYKRSLKMPGYWAFSIIVLKTLWQNKK